SFLVHVKYRRVGQLEGLRVSPHIYMTEADLDVFVDALRAAVKDA
ncbi:aminotransferase class V-fold PLP-dependent enzyme, partial [Paraburkholderia sp. UYCP14C]